MQVEWLYSGDPWANAYVAGNILVDAGVMPMAVAPFKEQIETIVLTHCHFDHIARVKEIAHMCRAKVAIHKVDARGLVDETQSLAMHFGARSPGFVPDITLSEGDTIGDFVVLHTPGHTPGCICLYSGKDRLLFSGDTVFTISPAGAGRNLPVRLSAFRRWMLKDYSQATASPWRRTAAGALRLQWN
jgi:hydroxyacylglutathione hydrolase